MVSPSYDSGIVKEGPRASFYGSEQSQNDALEFVNLLATYKFPHTYDGTIAGALA